MSKERARRRAEREAETAKRAAARAHEAAKQAKRRSRVNRLAQLLPRRVKWSTDTGLLAAKRRRTYGMVAAGFFLVQFLVWVSTPDWWARAATVVVSLLAIPLVLALTS